MSVLLVHRDGTRSLHLQSSQLSNMYNNKQLELPAFQQQSSNFAAKWHCTLILQRKHMILSRLVKFTFHAKGVWGIWR